MKRQSIRLLRPLVLLLVFLLTPLSVGAKKPDVQKLDQLYTAGVTALHAKKFKVAEKSLEEAFGIAQHLAATDSRHRRSLEALVRLYLTQRQWSAAEPWAEKIVVVDEQVHGSNHTKVSHSLANLAKVYLHLKKYGSAEKAYLRALKIRANAAPEEIWPLSNNLAETYRRWKKPAKAMPLYLQVLALKEKKLGKTDPKLATTLNDIGMIDFAAKRHRDAASRFKRAHDLAAKSPPAKLGVIKNNLANAYKHLNQVAAAEKLYKEAIALAKSAKPVNLPGLGNASYNLGILYASTKRYAEAAASYREAITARKSEYGSKHSRVKKTELALAAALDRLGKPGEAAALRAKHGL